MFCFSIMESSFCFANVEFITVPATSFIDDFGPLIVDTIASSLLLNSKKTIRFHF